MVDRREGTIGSRQLRSRFLAAISGTLALAMGPVACSKDPVKSSDAERLPTSAETAVTAEPPPTEPPRATDVPPTAIPTPSSTPKPTPSATTTAPLPSSSQTSPATSKPPSATGSPAKAALTPSCGSSEGEVTCFAPGSTHFNVGNVRAPGPGPKATFDAHGCQVQTEVRNSCCNPAKSGPAFIDGQCCYGFCTGVCCGRPLVVEGVARVAPVTQRPDWTEPLQVDLSGLSARQREELAQQWLADARLEHASIASFARFTLDLLAFGAPPDLVEACQRAAADEIRHARACFALASTYAGVTWGPGPLDMRGVTVSATLAEAAACALREGCINETTAALTAARQAELATDPVVREVLARIAHDEATHAELAWRFVAWAISVDGDAVRSALAAALAPPAEESHPAASELDLQPHGRLLASSKAEIARAAWADVIAPCASAWSAQA
jgi:hypothetical protein